MNMDLCVPKFNCILSLLDSVEVDAWVLKSLATSINAVSPLN